MIDKLVLRCPIRDKLEVAFDKNGYPVFTDTSDFLRLERLEIPLEASITPEGETYNLRHAWEKIPSSFADLAFKVFDFRGTSVKGDDFYIEIKASPAKIMQGHNLYGSDDLQECALALIECLYLAYPTLSAYLKHESWTVAEVDVTYHSRASTVHEAEMFINALQNISNGHTKSRHGYNGTAYFGKKHSRLKKLKVYNKFPEILEFLKTEERRGDPNGVLDIYTPELLDWAKGLIRWESTIKSRWFERRGYSTYLKDLVKTFNAQKFWFMTTKDIFEALEGQMMKIVKDEKVLEKLKKKYFTVGKKSGVISYAAANAAYRTYRMIKMDGFAETKSMVSDSTFYRHLGMLKAIGFSKAHLQNMNGSSNAEIIPFVRYVQVDFTAQMPDFVKVA